MQTETAQAKRSLAQLTRSVNVLSQKLSSTNRTVSLVEARNNASIEEIKKIELKHDKAAIVNSAIDQEKDATLQCIEEVCF